MSLSSQWGERRVIGTSDCLWGLLDGMNDRGLAVSLTFGGLPGTGQGFAIPLVVRYLLEVCDSVADACRVIDRIPVAASYNLTLTDRSGAVVTAFVAPGRVPEYFDMPLATNHRGLVPDRPDLARRFRSVERQDVLRGLDRRVAPPMPLLRSSSRRRCEAPTSKEASAPSTRRTTGRTMVWSRTAGPVPCGVVRSSRRTTRSGFAFGRPRAVQYLSPAALQ